MNQPEDSNTTFGFDLFANALAAQPGKNVLISPASARLALSTAVNGARGATKAAILDALGLPANASLRSLNQAQTELVQVLANAHPKVELAIANTLSTRQGVQFNKLFLNKNRRFYGAQLNQSDDLSDADLVWSSGGRFRDLSEAPTRLRDFTLADGTVVQRKVAYREGAYKYLRGDGFQCVRLPYGGGRLSMYVLLPDTAADHTAFLSRITEDNWSDWMSRLVEADGAVTMPTFQVAYETDLTPALTKMGMGRAFSTAADFGALCPRNRVKISSFRHTTSLEVRGAGEEAVVDDSTRSAEPGDILAVPVREKFTMVVDRPFVTALVDNQSGSLILLGSISEP